MCRASSPAALGMDVLPVCVLDAGSLGRLSLASVACWRIAGRVADGSRVELADSSASFLAREIEERTFHTDGRGPRQELVRFGTGGLPRLDFVVLCVDGGCCRIHSGGKPRTGALLRYFRRQMVRRLLRAVDGDRTTPAV